MKMQNILAVFVALLLVTSNFSYADDKLPAQFSFSIGSISTTYTEQQSQIKPTDGTTTTTSTPYSGTAASMPLDVEFEYFTTLKRSYFIRAGGPVMASTPDRNFYLTSGVNFYFSSVGSPLYVSDQRMEIKIAPKFRYYAGPHLGASYLVYNTKSATKNDVIVELGGQGGVIYSLSPKWGLRAEANLSRGIGALVSSMTMKILLGGTYNLNF